MAATVDDLIATMHSGVHVGQEGYDLRALQVRIWWRADVATLRDDREWF
jgi:hypothetical protein